MGNSQGNTRKITVTNDDTSGVIKVSESVIRRLKEGKETPPPSSPPAPPPPPAPEKLPPPPEKLPPPPEKLPPTPEKLPSPPEKLPSPPEKLLTPPEKLPPPPPLPPPLKVEKPQLLPPSEPIKKEPGVFPDPPREYPKSVYSSTSVPPSLVPQLNEEAHLALMRLRQEREEEIKNLEAHWHQKLVDVENQYVLVQKLTSEEFEKAATEVESLFNKKSCDLVCPESERKLLQCYKNHPKQSLLCSSYVQDFATCVNKFRSERTL